MRACSDSLIAVLEDDGRLHWSDGDVWEKVDFDGHWTGGFISNGILTSECGKQYPIKVITPKKFTIVLSDSLILEVLGEDAVLEKDGKLHWSGGNVWEQTGIDGNWTHGSISGTTLTFKDGTENTITTITSKKFSMPNIINVLADDLEEGRRSVDSVSSASETILMTHCISECCFEDAGNPRTQAALNELEIVFENAWAGKGIDLEKSEALIYRLQDAVDGETPGSNYGDVLQSRNADGNLFLKLCGTPSLSGLIVALAGWMIKSKADLNIATDSGDSALHLAVKVAASSESESLVKLLLEARHDPNVTNNAGVTPLFFALHCGRLEIIKDLLEAGADQCVAPEFAI